MDIFLIALAFVAGGLLPVQLAINAQLDIHWAHHPALTAFVSFTAGTIALGVYLLAARVPLPAITGQTAPWHWVGGFIGAFYVASMAMVLPRTGAAAAVAAVLAGQVCVSLALDHYALLGVAARELSWPRVLGVLLMMGGLFLVKRF